MNCECIYCKNKPIIDENFPKIVWTTEHFLFNQAFFSRNEIELTLCINELIYICIERDSIL